MFCKLHTGSMGCTGKIAVLQHTLPACRAGAEAHRLYFPSTQVWLSNPGFMVSQMPASSMHIWRSCTCLQGPHLTQQGPPLIDSQGIAMGIPVGEHQWPVDLIAS